MGRAPDIGSVYGWEGDLLYLFSAHPVFGQAQLRAATAFKLNRCRPRRAATATIRKLNSILMDLPEVALHYSTLAFRVRLAALTFVGAVLGASFGFFKEPREANVVGTALILVVGALSALNYRYTHSYICACYAASALPPQRDSDLAADRWHTFRVSNERPYGNWVMRMLLSWVNLSARHAGWVLFYST